MDDRVLDFAQLLTGRMRENPLWQELMKVVNDYVHHHITMPRNELQHIRDSESVHMGDTMMIHHGEHYGKTGTVSRVIIRHPSPGSVGTPPDAIVINIPDYGEVEIPFSGVQDRHWLVRNARMLGFDFFSSELTDKDYYRIAKFVSLYWPEGGNEQFINFMGFIKNVRFDLVQLWAKDTNGPANEDVEYGELSYQYTGTLPVWQGGEWYPTSHVEVRYDAELYKVTDLGDIRALFYVLAPIHLVLERIVSAIYGEWDIFIGLSAQYKALYQSSMRWQWEAGYTVITHAYAGSVADLQTLKHQYQWRVTGDLMMVVPEEAAVTMKEFGDVTWKSPGLLDLRPPETGGLSAVTQEGQHGRPRRTGEVTMYHPQVSGGPAVTTESGVERPVEWRNQNVNLGVRVMAASFGMVESGSIVADFSDLEQNWQTVSVFNFIETINFVCSIQNLARQGEFGTGTSCSVEMAVRSLYQGTYRHPVTV